MPQIALVGFGEAGSTFARAAGWGKDTRAFDIEPARREVMAGCGVASCDRVEDALDKADIVLSLVTADSALDAARDCARHVKGKTIWCDMNSVAPDTKREAAKHINAADGHYVDVAILAPVDPAGMEVPLLVSGNAAHDAVAMLTEIGYTNAKVVGDDIGRASAIKMVRSVMVKGIEALTAEMMLAAEAAGVTEEVLTSLDASEKPVSWRQRAAYNRERMETHGIRRAAEMIESAKTLEALGVEPVMTRGTVQRQREMATQATKRSEAA